MFGAGDHLVLREVFRGRVWRATAAILVKIESDLLVFWVPPGAEMRLAVSDEGYALINQPETWAMQERRWSTPGALRLAPPGEPYSIWQLGAGTDELRWYVNLEEPLRPSRVGFDYLDHKLDLLLYPDGTYQWKDEDHLEEAVALGNFSAAEAEAMRVAGERVLQRFLAGWRPFEEWLDWQPDPAWTVPVLPPGWQEP